MNPPTCRFCKKTEWRHRCMGVEKINLKAIEKKIKAKPPAKPPKTANRPKS